jgi:hypothetical protein
MRSQYDIWDRHSGHLNKLLPGNGTQRTSGASVAHLAVIESPELDTLPA